jgi:antirestriction protein
MADASRFYVACLASYNNGTLRGAYVTPSEFADGDEMATAIDAYIISNEVVPGIDPGGFAAPVPYGAEEYLVHDYVDGPICYLSRQLGETSNWEQLWNICDLLDNHDNVDALVAFMEHTFHDHDLNDLDSVVAAFSERFRGEHSSHRDFAYDWAEETVEGFDDKVSEWPFSCIDWDHAWNELTMGAFYSISNPNGGYWFFTSA